MSFDQFLKILPIIVSILVGVCLFIARGLFNEAKEVRSRVDLNAIDSLHKLASFVRREMQDDVERCFCLSEPPMSLGEEYHAHRRDDAASNIAIKIWDKAKNQKELENIYENWSACEGFGRYICGIGTFINLIALLCLLAITILRPAQIILNNNYIWIALSIIALPIICAFICFIIAFSYKHRFHKINERLSSVSVQEEIDE